MDAFHHALGNSAKPVTPKTMEFSDFENKYIAGFEHENKMANAYLAHGSTHAISPQSYYDALVSNDYNFNTMSPNSMVPTYFPPENTKQLEHTIESISPGSLTNSSVSQMDERSTVAPLTHEQYGAHCREYNAQGDKLRQQFKNDYQEYSHYFHMADAIAGGKRAIDYSYPAQDRVAGVDTKATMREFPPVQPIIPIQELTGYTGKYGIFWGLNSKALDA